MATVTKPIIKDETGQEIISAIQGLKDTIMTNDSSLADPFSTSVSYAVGDYCIYESTLYKCVVAHTGAWNDTHFIVTKAMDEVESINEKIGDVIDEDTTPTIISYTPTIAVDNALGVNAEDVKVKIEPVQAGSGTPSPTNIRPITGWDEVNVTRSGENLFDPSKAERGYISDNDGLKRGYNTDGNYCTNYIKVSPNTDYIISVSSSMQNGRWGAWYDKNKNFIGGVNRTQYNQVIHSPNTACYLRFTLSYDNNNPNYATTIQLEQGSTATPYEPYQGNTYTIDLNGTRYGGTLDVTSGELTVTHGYVDLGNLSWSKYGTSTAYDRYISNGIDAYSKEGGDGVCSHYLVLHTWQVNALIIGNGGSRLSIFTTYGEYADATAFKASLSGAQLVYELATPQIIQLTPTQIKMLQGNNTLFADSGDTQLTYYNSTIGNIGEVVGELESDKANKSDIASINVTGTANSTGSAIASGTYFYLNDVLVKAKTDIANGATFTKNTNYEEVTAGSLNDMNSKMDYMFNIIRGRQLPIIDLGTSYTAELKSDISSGRFEKAIVGGKLTINGHVYYLAHPNYWLHTGDTECTTNHMLVVPAGNLVKGKMNNSNITTGAYVGSDFKTGANGNTALADIKSIIKADFGAANILTHREYFANATANGRPSAGAWYDSDIDLMDESMVYGGDVFSPHSDGTNVPAKYTIDKTQIKLFAERPDLITIRAGWWLRDVVSSAHFADVATDGLCDCSGASNAAGVRPAFAIC